MALARKDPKTLYDEALEDMKNKKFEKAIEKLLKAKNGLSADEESSTNEGSSADEESSANEGSSADEKLNQKIFLKLTESYLRAGEEEKFRKRNTQAEYYFNRIIDLCDNEISKPLPISFRGNLVFACLNLGAIFSPQNQNDSKKAKDNFDKARTMLGEEEFDLYHYLSGQILYRERKFHEAFAAFSKHSDENLSCAKTHYYKGLCLQNLNKHGEAIGCFQKARDIETKEKNDEQDWMNREDEAFTYIAWARSCCELKEYKNAIQLFNDAYQNKPDIKKGFIINAYDKVSENNIIYVAENMEVLLEYKPEDPEIKKQLARVYSRLGKHYSDKHSTVLTAICYFKKSLDLDAANEDTKAQYIKALMTCIKSRDFSSKHRGQYFEEIAKLLNWDFSSINLRDVSKNTILFAINQQPQELKIRLLKACLNPSTQLGEKIWDKESFFECSLMRDGSRVNAIMKELQAIRQNTGRDVFLDFVYDMIINGDLEKNDGYKKFADVKPQLFPYFFEQGQADGYPGGVDGFLGSALDASTRLSKFYRTQRGMAVPNHGTGELEKIKNAKNRLDREAEIAALTAMLTVGGHYFGNGPRPNPAESGQPSASNNAAVSLPRPPVALGSGQASAQHHPALGSGQASAQHPPALDSGQVPAQQPRPLPRPFRYALYNDLHNLFNNFSDQTTNRTNNPDVTVVPGYKQPGGQQNKQ